MPMLGIVLAAAGPHPHRQRIGLERRESIRVEDQPVVLDLLETLNQLQV